MERMEFAFKTKGSRNGWLSFMYPRLRIARDLLSDDGVLFASIDDSEQADLKLLLDEIFGGDNFVSQLVIRTNPRGENYSKGIAREHEYVLIYAKSEQAVFFEEEKDRPKKYTDHKGEYDPIELNNTRENRIRPTLFYPVWVNAKLRDRYGFHPVSLESSEEYSEKVEPRYGYWKWCRKKVSENIVRDDPDNSDVVARKNGKGEIVLYRKNRKTTGKPKSIWNDSRFFTQGGGKDLEALGMKGAFSYPKPVALIRRLVSLVSRSDGDIVLDFFAGSGTTGQAVAELNGEDGLNRRFILCQSDESLNSKKSPDAVRFCTENGLEPVVSSITAERLKRAGVGFKCFDLVMAPKTEIDGNGKIVYRDGNDDPLSRIVGMIFKIGEDDPLECPSVIREGVAYGIGDNIYITNADGLDRELLRKMIRETEGKRSSTQVKGGVIYIDGWTASLDASLQTYRKNVEIVFTGEN